jgi:hypothetical protein
VTDQQQLDLHVDQQPPRLSPRQQRALDVMQTAGRDGLHAAELGARVHAWQERHPADKPCEWCETAGLEMLKALRRHGLVRERRPRGQRGYWQAVGAASAAFGELPEGF